MERPLADKRPLGPFAQRSSMDTVLLTCDFGVEPEATRLSREEMLDRKQSDLKRFVSRRASEYFNGEVVDVRREDHAVDGEEGIRVVYDTQINAVFKDDVDEFEKDIRGVRGVAAYYGKMTIVSSSK
jgi:hypothetical protein